MEQAKNNLISELSTPLLQASGWMKFLGIVMIIAGVIYALTIIGIIFAWLPIWMGVLLFQAASSTEQANTNNDQAALFTALSKIKVFFVIMGVIMLLNVIMSVLVGILFAMGIGAGLLSQTGGSF